jgi:hypothetical protein
MSPVTLHELAWCACPIGCHSGPCADCYLVARRMLLRLTGAGVVPLDATRRIVDHIPQGEPA